MDKYMLYGAFVTGFTLTLTIIILWPIIKEFLGFGETNNPHKWRIVKITNKRGDVRYELDNYIHNDAHWGSWDSNIKGSAIYLSSHKFDKLEDCKAFHAYLKEQWDKKRQYDTVKKDVVK